MLAAGKAETGRENPSEKRVLQFLTSCPARVAACDNRRGESAQLPCTAWSQIDTVEKGGWGECGVEPVIIQATMGLDKGVWYRIRQGICGLMVRDERGCLRVYVVPRREAG
jgi:hypothetical protein